MTSQGWNPDEALVPEPDTDVDTVGAVWRYGVTGYEAAHVEPLDVALSQEDPETAPDEPVDDPWADCDATDQFAGRLMADEQLGDDDYAIAVDDEDIEFSPEELAMHLVEP
jgi:hypothetical protein